MQIEKKFKPFYKWSGGKSKEFTKVTDWMPSSYDTYYEPFLGGGAIWLGLAPEKCVVGDFYDEVSNFFMVLKKHGNVFIDECNEISKDYNEKIKQNLKGLQDVKIDEKSKEMKKYSTGKSKEDLKKDPKYQKIKEELKSLRALAKKEFSDNSKIFYDWRNKTPIDDKDKAKRFFVLRCLAYGGMLRFNSDGKFNVPYGYYKSFKSLIYPKGIAILLNSTTILNDDWKQTVSTAKTNDFCFFDPPYTREFKEYSSGNVFGNKQHIELADYFKSKKSKCMIIINKDDFTYELYKDYIKEEYVFNYSTKYRDRLSKEDNEVIHFVACNY